MPPRDRRQLTVQDYHVAWICAVRDLELLPARLMLDADHLPPLYDTEYNEYNYLFGEIYGHNVVIATLLHSMTGNVNSAHMAGQLFKTFPNIRIALLVGIGGGIPLDPPHTDPLQDIHLGDVVVGYPLSGHPPSIYYQFGRFKPEGREILRKGRMEDPDRRVLSGLDTLISNYEFDPEDMQAQFSEQLKRLREHERHRHKFQLPPPDSDKLFKADNHHQGAWGDCDGCHSLKLVKRPPRRDEDRDTLVFHKGMIAIGNEVVQDGEERDRVRQLCDGFARCVEMEAAGVAVNRKCLIIRGISDYADSHKNDEWRECAAGHAAAFARQLLRTIPAGKLRAEEESEQASHRHQEPSPFIVPYCSNPDFIGRSEILEELRAKLGHMEKAPENKEAHLRACVQGLGGVGKTQIAVAYIFRLRAALPDVGIFWVHGGTTDRFRESYLNIARRCHIPGHDDPSSDVLHLVKDWLACEKAGRWLMVLDNADDTQVFFPESGEGVGKYIPACSNGAVLITTRNREAGSMLLRGKRPIEVKAMGSHNSLDLLRLKLEDDDLDDGDLSTLSLRLGGLPLAIVQAAAYMNAKAIPVRRYIAMLDNSDDDLVNLLSKEFETVDREPGTSRAVVETWILSFKQIQEQNPFASKLLSLMSFFDRQAIPRQLLSAYEKRQRLGLGGVEGRQPLKRRVGAERRRSNTSHSGGRRQLNSGCKNSTRLRQATRASRTLRSYLGSRASASSRKVGPRQASSAKGRRPRTQSLVTTDVSLEPSLGVLKAFSFVSENNDGTLDMHHLVQLATRRWLENEGSAPEFATDALLVVSDGYPDGYQFGNRDECRRLAPHASAVLELQSQQTDEADRARAWLLVGVAGLSLLQDQLEVAKNLLEQSLRIAKRRWGKEARPTLCIMQRLGIAYRLLGRLHESVSLGEDLVQTAERVFGDEDGDTITVMGDLAEGYKQQGRLAEAELLERQALERNTKKFGEKHTTTLSAMANLALTKFDLGQAKEAEALAIQVLERRRKILGQEDPDTLVAIMTLGSVYYRRDRHEEAELLITQALEGYRKIGGERHPGTLRAMQHLAATFHRQGRYKKAELLLAQLAEKLAEVLGKDSIATSRCFLSLGFTYQFQGQWEKAESLQLQVLERMKRAVGEKHRETLSAMYDLAVTWRGQGRTQKAIGLLEEVCRALPETAGRLEPRILAAPDKLAEWKGGEE